MNSSLKILCVDDEPNILQSFQRQLRGQFDLDIATRGDVGLSLITKQGPYAIVVSDMRMPGMDGVEFLQRVKKEAPDTVRLMLTGNADQESAMRAVNEGNIFRFLTKPCSIEDLTKALDDAAAQYRLIISEKDLLQNTLSGSIKLLTDVLSFIDPTSFGHAIKLRQFIQNVVSELALPNAWEIELAGMLSNIGFVTVPSTVMTKYRTGATLLTTEQEIIDKVPAIGQSLIANIPRLEGVAKIVLYQSKNFDGTGNPPGAKSGEEIPEGARIIKILKDLLQFEVAGISQKEALEKMKRRPGWYDQDILSAVSQILFKPADLLTTPQETKIFEVTSHQLEIGQSLMANVETKDGILLLSAGTVITETLLERLTNYAKFVGLKEPLQVDHLAAAGK